MKLIGRRLRLNWGKGKMVEIGIFPNYSDMPLSEHGEIVDVYECMGEIIEKKRGRPDGNTYGWAIDSILQDACAGGSVWLTTEESNAICEQENKEREDIRIKVVKGR